MDRYIGIDAHKQSCTVAVVGPSGKRLKLQVVPTLGAALVECVRGVAGERHVHLEEGTQSAWLYELLSPHAVEVVVTVAERRTRGNKSDAEDAWGLAERLRRGALDVRVFKAPSLMTGLRAAVRAHVLLTRDLTRAKNRLQALFRSRGLHEAGVELYDSTTRTAWVARLPAALRELAALLGEEHDALADLQTRAEKLLLQEAKRHQAVRLLATAPGIADIRAAYIVGVVGTPERFRTKRQFWSYCGLGIVTRASAQWVPRQGAMVRVTDVQTLGLNRNRQPLLKNVFKGAAHTVVVNLPQHPLSQDYQRKVAAGAKDKLALLTLARRLAAATLTMWKSKEAYDPAKHCAKKAA
jgi:transposase